MYAREPGRYIIQCEEFEGERKAISANEEAPPDPIRNHVYHEEAPPGLCRNCKKFPKCKFTKPEGGVWHCEEYE